MTINVDNPNGFTPVGTMSGSPWNGYVRAYEVDSSSTIFMGDLVILEADGRVAPADAGSLHILGVCVGALNHVAGPIAASGKMDGNFMANTSPTLSPSYSNAEAGWVLVAVGTDVLYEVQEDGVSDPIEIVDVGLNVDIVTTHSGSTLTGKGAQEINSDSHTTASAQLRLIGVADKPNNQPYDLDTTQNGTCRWIVRINESHFALQDMSVTTGSTAPVGI
jgi:hypothetical protein